MDNTKIEWCDSTWNPVTGCLHNCEYCYAKRIAHRFGGFTEFKDTDLDYQEICESDVVKIEKPLKYLDKKGRVGESPYPFYFTPTFYHYKLDEPQHWKKPRTVFVCSMADLFGEWVPDEWIEEVFAACEKAPQHRYMFLTKNPQRYIELARAGKLLKKDNMWYGSTVTAMEEYFSSEVTFNTFLSIEPILTSISPLTIENVKWVIIGAETGNRRNKVIPKKEWINNICKITIPVFMKDSLLPIVGEENMRREFPWRSSGQICRRCAKRSKDLWDIKISPQELRTRNQ